MRDTEERFETFVGRITHIYKSIQKLKSLEMTEQGLKGNHTMCLYNLGRRPDGLTAAELAVLCEEDKAAISRTLSELGERGYVYDNTPASAKKYRAKVFLTPKGEEVALFIQTRSHSLVEQGGNGLTDESRDNFYTSLELIAQNLQKLLSENI